jgi:hypothetical protein
MLSRIRLVLGLAVATLGLGSCSTIEIVERQFDASTPTEVSTLNQRYTTRIMIGGAEHCQWKAASENGSGSVGLRSIGNLAVPLIGDAIFNLIDGAIKSYGESLSTSYFAKGVGNLADEKTMCLIVARGYFGSAGSSDSNWPSKKLDQRKAEGLGLVGYPDFYFEASVVKEGDNVALTPVVFSFGKTAAKRSGDGSKEIHIFLSNTGSISVSPASTNPSQNMGSVAVFSLGRVKMGTEFWHDADDTLKNPFWEQTSVIKVESKGASVLGAQVYELEKSGALESALFKAYENGGGTKLKEAIGTILKAIAEGSGNLKSN